MTRLARHGAMVAIALLVGGLTACDRPADITTRFLDEDTRRVAQEAGAMRPIEARLSGFDEWRPWSAGGTPISETARGSLLLSAAAIEQRQAAANDPALDAALGVRHLLLGEAPVAIRLLERSRRAPGDRARRLNDLAAACFAQASGANNHEQLAYSLDLAEAAATENPALLAARFNRALILESLGPTSRAADAWSDYLRADSTSAWAREAEGRRERLAALARQKSGEAAAAQALSRSSVETQLLAWANAVGVGKHAEAADKLAGAKSVADQILTRDKNPYPTRLVEDARRHQRLGRTAQFARAFASAYDAPGLIQTNNAVQAATARIEEAKALISPGGAFSDFLAYWQLHAEWYLDRPGLEQRVRELIRRTERNGSSLFAARSHVLLGSILQKEARFSDAIASYQRGTDMHAAFGERPLAASTRALFAASLREHGMWQEAWRSEAMALADYERLDTDGQRHLVLLEATRLANARQQTDLAALYLTFVEAHARERKLLDYQTIAAVNAARIALQRGRPADASAHLARAEEVMRDIPDKAFRDSYRLEILTLKTEVQTRVAPALAVQTARELLQTAYEKNVLFRRVRAHWLLGRAALADGRRAEAEAAWRDGIDALESDNKSAREERLRIARTSDVWEIYDDLIRLLVDNRQPHQALEVAERGRARALLASLDATYRPAPITATLGTRATILYYALLRDRTLIWLIDGESIALHDVPGGTAHVDDLISDLRDVAAPGADPRAVLRRLYAALILPVSGSFVKDRPLIIVPDGAIAEVPFPALLSAKTGQPLVIDHELVIAPSLAALALPFNGPSREGDPVRLLAVAAPEAVPGLPALPGARKEVTAIARLYDDRQAFVGGAVSVDAFLTAVRGSDVVHFAGHAIEDRVFPSQSFLALPGSARLFPAAIRTADFRNVQLLVLSACSTAGGAVARGEGVLSLARPFLAAGVRQVLGTVTAVDDEVAQLLVEFHIELRAGARPAAALRTVQRKAYLRDEKISLRGWAAFELFGVTPAR